MRDTDEAGEEARAQNVESQSRSPRERLISGRKKERFRQTLRTVTSAWSTLPVGFPLSHPNLIHTSYLPSTRPFALDLCRAGKTRCDGPYLSQEYCFLNRAHTKDSTERAGPRGCARSEVIRRVMASWPRPLPAQTRSLVITDATLPHA